VVVLTVLAVLAAAYVGTGSWSRLFSREGAPPRFHAASASRRRGFLGREPACDLHFSERPNSLLLAAFLLLLDALALLLGLLTKLGAVPTRRPCRRGSRLMGRAIGSSST
jgi:hypothetical protein